MTHAVFTWYNILLLLGLVIFMFSINRGIWDYIADPARSRGNWRCWQTVVLVIGLCVLVVGFCGLTIAVTK